MKPLSDSLDDETSLVDLKPAEGPRVGDVKVARLCHLVMRSPRDGCQKMKSVRAM
jgi:hypothetical protein